MVSPREPNVGCVFWVISVIYAKAGGSFVKQVTSGGFSLRQGRPERVGDFRVDNGAGGYRLRQGQAMGQQLQPWRSGKSLRSENPGGREMAKDVGCRCWSMPWKNFPGPIFVACRAIRRCWSRCAPSWRVRYHLVRLAHPVSACEIKLAKTTRVKDPATRIRQIRPRRLHSPAICSRGCLPRSIPRSLASSSAM